MAGPTRARLTAREGRRFALTVGCAFLLLGGLLWWRGRETSVLAMGTVGGALILAGLVIPGHLGPVHRAWMRLAFLLSRVTTPVFLALVYLFVITPTGLVLRLFGRRPMRHEASSDGYWNRRDANTGSDMRRLF